MTSCEKVRAALASGELTRPALEAATGLDGANVKQALLKLRLDTHEVKAFTGPDRLRVYRLITPAERGARDQPFPLQEAWRGIPEEARA